MRKFIASDTAIKILSIIAAVIMWLYVMNELNPQRTTVIREVPVKLQNLDESKFAVKGDPSEFKVNVRVKGRHSQVTDLRPDDINAQVNMRGRIEGENLIRVDVTIPPNTEFIDVSPREILVVLDSIIEEQVPILVDVAGIPERGFAAGEPVTKPQEVVVKGPRSMVNAVKKVLTKIDITDKNSTVVSTLPVRVLDGKDQEQKKVTFRPDVVEVTVPIVPVSNVRILPKIEGSPPVGYIIKDVKVNPSVITVTGNTDILGSLESINTRTINIEGKTFTDSMNVELIFPKGVTAFDESIQSVKVIIEIEELNTDILDISSDEIEAVGLAPELSAEFERKKISVTVSGPQSIIDNVDNNNIKLKTDVSGLTEGEHSVKIDVDILSPYKIILIEPSNISVILSKKGGNK